jgi:hypothetical protein
LFLLDFKGVLHRTVFSQDQYNAFFTDPAATPFIAGVLRSEGSFKPLAFAMGIIAPSSFLSLHYSDVTQLLFDIAVREVQH